MSRRKPLRIAIVGSGPAGMYAASHLYGSPQGSWLDGKMIHLTDEAFEIDLIDRLPTPWGLVRGGVAPDHPEKKQITRIFEKIARRPDFRFFGNVELGGDVGIDELTQWYDAVLLAHGAAGDRTLGIPGEDLPGCASARDFVAWYNGHPDASHLQFDLSHERAVVVGNGNVALDVARMLVRSPEDLAHTDIADHALEALRRSRVKEVVILGRRGPLQAAFNSPELEELAELPGVDVLITGTLPSREEALAEGADLPTLRKLELLHAFSARTATEGNRRIVLRFLESPTSLHGAGCVSGVRVARNRIVSAPDEAPIAQATDTTFDLEAGLVLRAVGYAGIAVPGLPFDKDLRVIPNRDGRVLINGAAVPGLYVAGWAKRGPSGIIGTNRKCALDTVRAVIEDAGRGSIGETKVPDSVEVAKFLAQRQPKSVSYKGWQAIDRVERLAGAGAGRPRIKLVSRTDLLEAATPQEREDSISSARKLDVIVIGSGLGGLVTAAALAAKGKSVAVLEQHEIAGGCSQVFRRKGMFEFDYGIHYLSECTPGSDGMLATTLRGLGIEDRIEWSRLDDAGMDTVLFPNHELKVPTSWEGLKQNLMECFPADADGLAKSVDGLRAIGVAAASLNDIPHSVSVMMRLLKRPFDALKVVNGLRLSMTQYADQFGLGVEARAGLLSSVFIHNTAPDKVPALLVAAIWQSFFRPGSGAYFPRKGSQVIPANLVEVIRAYGGVIRTKARVRSIDIEDGRVMGVTLSDGERLRSDSVVSNADPHRTFQDLIEPRHLRKRVSRRVENLRRTHSFFTTFLGADIDLSKTRPATNHILYDRYDLQTTFDTLDRGQWDPKAWLNVSCPTLKTRGENPFGPPGHTVLEAFTTVPAEYSFWGGGDPMAGTGYKWSAEYQDRKAEVEAVIVERTLRALPELRGHIVYQESATPLTHERFTLSRMPYGPENARDQIGPFGRLSAKTEIKGLYLAGAATSYMYGVMFTMRGGLGTASEILGEQDLFEQFREGRVIVDPSVLPEQGPEWDPFEVSRGMSGVEWVDEELRILAEAETDHDAPPARRAS